MIEDLGCLEGRHEHEGRLRIDQVEIAAQIRRRYFGQDEAIDLLDAVHGKALSHHVRIAHANETQRSFIVVHALKRRAQVVQGAVQLVFANCVLGAENHRTQLREFLAVADRHECVRLMRSRHIHGCAEIRLRFTHSILRPKF